MKNQLTDWLAENVNRLFVKSPKFYQVWQWVSGAVVAISGLPLTLDYLGIKLPAPYDALENKTVLIAAGVALFMSSLSSQSKVVSNTKDGVIVTPTDAAKLPFSAAVETKAIAAADTPTT